MENEKVTYFIVLWICKTFASTNLCRIINSEWLRSAICSHLFKKTGKNITIKHGAYFGDGRNIVMGDYSQLGINCKVENDLVMGDYVLMGPEVVIYSSMHAYDDLNIPIMMQGAKEIKPVIIGNDVWIGLRAIIMPGVKIGNHVIIRLWRSSNTRCTRLCCGWRSAR